MLGVLVDFRTHRKSAQLAFGVAGVDCCYDFRSSTGQCEVLAVLVAPEPHAAIYVRDTSRRGKCLFKACFPKSDHFFYVFSSLISGWGKSLSMSPDICANIARSDQFCSLVFTLSNLYFIPCTYTVGFDDWRQCTTSTKNWPVMFVVGTLPLTIRVVQSIKRYYDSRLVTHLVNVRFSIVSPAGRHSHYCYRAANMAPALSCTFSTSSGDIGVRRW